MKCPFALLLAAFPSFHCHLFLWFRCKFFSLPSLITFSNYIASIPLYSVLSLPCFCVYSLLYSVLVLHVPVQVRSQFSFSFSFLFNWMYSLECRRSIFPITPSLFVPFCFIRPLPSNLLLFSLSKAQNLLLSFHSSWHINHFWQWSILMKLSKVPWFCILPVFCMRFYTSLHPVNSLIIWRVQWKRDENAFFPSTLYTLKFTSKCKYHCF